MEKTTVNDKSTASTPDTEPALINSKTTKASKTDKAIEKVKRPKKIKEPRKDTGIGTRIRDARISLKLSQAAVAKYVGLQRTSVTNWENGRSVPDTDTIAKLGNLFPDGASWIAYEVSAGPTMVDPDPDKLGYALISEVLFGSSPTAKMMTSQWGIPTSYLRNECGVTAFDKLIMYRAEAAFADNRYKHGDRLIIDQSVTRPSPAGTFLFWDGVGPSLADITVVPTQHGKKVVAKVHTLHGVDFEADVDSIAILGRVQGLWRKV